MTIEHIIIFCAAQSFILVLVLLQKKFRTLHNYLLLSLIILLLLHYVYYYTYYKNIIHSGSVWQFLFVLISILPPSIVFYYSKSFIYGHLDFNVKNILYLIPFLFSTFLFALLIFIENEKIKSNITIIGYEALVLTYLIYPYLILKELSKFYHIKVTRIKKIYQFNKSKTVILRLFLNLMMLHFFILLFKINLPFLFENTTKVLDIINLGLLLILSYAITYVIITEPGAINSEKKKPSLGGLRSYSKSGMTISKAQQIGNHLNEIMETHKPYLDMNFNLSMLSTLSGYPPHTISEVLNGLFNQNFNDYLNNYRLEEFKKLVMKKENQNKTILSLAYDSGFRSKATFNNVFKKFTGKTPSQYLREIRGIDTKP